MRKIWVGILVLFFIGVFMGVGVSSVSADHVNNTSGEDVKVGVIDGQYDTSNSEISSNVNNNNTYIVDDGTRDEVFDDSSGTHGTAVSEVVVRDAPKSELYLVGSGDRLPNKSEFQGGIDWLINQDVDIIVVSLGYWGHPYDGNGETSQAVSQARDEGIVVVTASGNSANRHWKGNFTDTDNDDRHEFQSSEKNHFDMEDVNGDGSYEYEFFFSKSDWEDSTDATYELQVYNDESVINSVSLTDNHTKVFGQVSSKSNPYIRIEKTNPGNSIELEVFSRNSNFIDESVSEGSIVAPASSEGSLTVGSIYDNGTLTQYSSQGPTSDGRHGIDVVDETCINTVSEGEFCGTSSSAPNVAGDIASLLSFDSNLSADDIEHVVTESTGDVQTSDRGYGIFNSERMLHFGEFTIRRLQLDENNRIRIQFSNEEVLKSQTNVNVTVDEKTVGSLDVQLDGEESINRTLVYPFSRYGNRTIGIGGFSKDVTIDSDLDTIDISHSDTLKYTISNIDFGNISKTGSTVVTINVSESNSEYDLTVDNLESHRKYYVYKDGDLTVVDSGINGKISTTFEESGQIEVVSGDRSSSSVGDSETVYTMALVSGIIIMVGIIVIIRKRGKSRSAYYVT